MAVKFKTEYINKYILNMKKIVQDLVEVFLTMVSFVVGMFLIYFIFSFSWALIKSFFQVIF